jgi:chemotaxis protein CheD
MIGGTLQAERAPPTDAAADAHKIHVIQGEFHVSSDANVVMTTILGSCVAACLRDPAAGVGGMNHFLLPGEVGDAGLRYGVQSMELLVNGLLRRGARRERLEAKLFGGARMHDSFSDIGLQNAEFAERFLRDEGVTVLGGSLRGDQARRIQFWPVSGRARQIALPRTESGVFAAERRHRPAPAADGGALELF